MWRMRTGKLIESADAARILEVTPSYVRMLARLGKLTPRYVTPRGGRLYDVTDVLSLAAERGARR